MSGSFRLLLCIAVAALAALPLYGEEDDPIRWEAAWSAAAAEASFVPSVLAGEIALRELGAAAGDSVEGRARGAFKAAMRVEYSLRAGYSAQEARVRLRRALRLAELVGPEYGKRISAKLEKLERKNKPAVMAAPGKGRDAHKNARGR